MVGVYKHEMTDDDHRELIDILLNHKGKVMLSGYAHDIYLPLIEAGWTAVEFQTGCYAAGRTKATKLQSKGAVMEKQSRTEIVYINYGVERYELFNATQKNI